MRRQRHWLIFTIVLFVSFAYHALASFGSIELDEYNFDKVTNKFEASLIKFDILYPFGYKHEAFMAFVNDSLEEKDLLFAEVLVKDNADKSNVALARKYGATKNNFPMVKLFVKGKPEPIQFDGATGFTSDELRRFVQNHSGLHLSLPGCFKEFDKLAIQFMRGKKDKRKRVLKKTKELLKDMKSSSRKIYRTVMEKVLEKGNDFIQYELDRVKKMLGEKVSEEKKKQFGTRINILQTFQNFDEQATIAKEDL